MNQRSSSCRRLYRRSCVFVLCDTHHAFSQRLPRSTVPPAVATYLPSCHKKSLTAEALHHFCQLRFNLLLHTVLAWREVLCANAGGIQKFLHSACQGFPLIYRGRRTLALRSQWVLMLFNAVVHAITRHIYTRAPPIRSQALCVVAGVQDNASAH